MMDACTRTVRAPPAIDNKSFNYIYSSDCYNRRRNVAFFCPARNVTVKASSTVSPFDHMYWIRVTI